MKNAEVVGQPSEVRKDARNVHWPLQIVEQDGVLLLLDARSRGDSCTFYRARKLDAALHWRLRGGVARERGAFDVWRAAPCSQFIDSHKIRAVMRRTGRVNFMERNR